MARERVVAKGGHADRVWHECADPDALAQVLARAVASALKDAIAERGKATLAVSGGTTPVRFFRALSGEVLDWEKVTVTLVDERFVPPSSDRSNARLVTLTLLQNEAARAHFEGLYEDCADAEVAAKIASGRLGRLPPFDVVVLGMGLDGHVASFFPDAFDLDTLIDPAGRQDIAAVHAMSAGEARLTWPLAALKTAGLIVLHIEGQAKKDALIEALAPANPAPPPVRALFEHAQTPVHIHWAPGGKA